ncbi:MAG: hypothetical protein V4864_01605 [Pseudomonadota bacterium]
MSVYSRKAGVDCIGGFDGCGADGCSINALFAPSLIPQKVSAAGTVCLEPCRTPDIEEPSSHVIKLQRAIRNAREQTV